MDSSKIKNTWKIYMLAFISFFVSTSEYVIAGILDKIAAWVHISIPAARQLITVFAIAFAIGAPIFVMATTRIERRKLLMVSLVIVVFGVYLSPPPRQWRQNLRSPESKLERLAG